MGISGKKNNARGHCQPNHNVPQYVITHAVDWTRLSIVTSHTWNVK